MLDEITTGISLLILRLLLENVEVAIHFAVHCVHKAKHLKELVEVHTVVAIDVHQLQELVRVARQFTSWRQPRIEHAAAFAELLLRNRPVAIGVEKVEDDFKGAAVGVHGVEEGFAVVGTAEQARIRSELGHEGVVLDQAR